MSPPPERSDSDEPTVLVRASSLHPKKPKAPSAARPPPKPGDWRPYRLKDLPQVSRSDILLLDRVAALVPGIASSGRVPAASLARLKELFDEEVGMVLDTVHVVPPSSLKQYASDPTVLGVLVPAPQKARGFVEVELSLAHAVVDLLLGGAGESIALRALTEIEEGVLSFVIIEALKSLAPKIDPGLPRLRLEGMAPRVQEMVDALRGERAVAVVQLEAQVGPHSGYLRLFLPESVLALANPGAPTPERVRSAHERARAHLGRLVGVSLEARVEIGQLELTAQDLAGLKMKDVVLVDTLTFRPDQAQAGPARLRVGRGQVGFAEASCTLEQGRYRATLSRFQLGADPQGAGGAVEEGKEEAGAQLLGDIPLQIAVELARVPITAEGVLGLKVGQVLELNRGPNEPVQLSVNGKPVAQGELVEVEGRLGVRILSLAE